MKIYPIILPFANGTADTIDLIAATSPAAAVAQFKAQRPQDTSFNPFVRAGAARVLGQLAENATIRVNGETMKVSEATTSAWEACEVLLRYEDGLAQSEELKGNVFRADTLSEIAALLGETPESLREEIAANGTLL